MEHVSYRYCFASIFTSAQSGLAPLVHFCTKSCIATCNRKHLIVLIMGAAMSRMIIGKGSRLLPYQQLAS